MIKYIIKTLPPPKYDFEYAPYSSTSGLYREYTWVSTNRQTKRLG